MRKSLLIGIAAIAMVMAICCVAIAADLSAETKHAAVDSALYADFMANEVLNLQDLAEGADVQRRMFDRMTPPGLIWTQPMYPPVVPFDTANFDKTLLDSLPCEEQNSVAVYPLSLALDPKTRDTFVYNAEGKQITTIPAGKSMPGWPADADPARVTLQLSLLPVKDVEHYLYTEDRITETAVAAIAKSAKYPRKGSPATKSLGASEFGICNIQHLTNGSFRLTVTNGEVTAEIYSYTVLHTSAVAVITWTNEQSNVVTDTNTVWTPVTPPFNGIESAWVVVTTNLALTNGVGVGEDTNVSSNDRVRFYAVANRLDTDEDGLSDGAEILLHRTDPDLADTDSDDMPDGWEVSFGLDPLDNGETVRNNGAAGDIDGDGYLNIYECVQGGNPTNAQSIPGAAIFVDASAGTNGTGTAQNPFNTIQAALDAAADYDIISLAPGTYSGSGNVMLDYAGKPVMVQGYGEASGCIIDCAWASAYGIDLHTGEDNRSVLSNVRICHAQQIAIRGSGTTFPSIQYCQIVSNGAAFQAYEGGAWFRNCEISQNSADWAVISADEDLVLENCILAHNADTSEWDSVVSFFGERLQINNCTLVDNPLVPIDLWSISTNHIQINNSILWSNAYNLAQCLFGGTVRFSCIQGGYAGVGNISSNPSLTGSRYRLKYISPCIDAGNALDMPTSDFVDSPRWDDPSRTNSASFYDMGAMEFTDADADGMDDFWENARGIAGATNDPDDDSLSNMSEYQLGTEPNSADTDGDMLNDGVEITTYYTDPLEPDTDHDCLFDGDEFFGDQTHGDTDGLTTNPFNVDTDGDGYADCPGCPQVGTCKAPDPHPTIVDGSYYTLQLSAASNEVAYGQTVQVSAQVVATNGGASLSGKFDLALAVNGGGYIETNIPAGTMVGESFFPGVCRARTDDSGHFTANVRATAGGRIVVSATEVGCGILPEYPKNLAAVKLPFKGAAWYGGWLRCLETQAVVQISLTNLDALANGWSSGASTGAMEGISFNQITVGKDGYLLLGAQPAATNYAIAMSNAPNGFLAPFFTAIHWKPESRVYADVIWELEPRFIAEWNHVGLQDDEAADLTFQAQIWLQSGIVRFAYFAMENGSNNLADGHAALIGMKFNNSNHFTWTSAISNGAGVELAATSMPAIVVTCDDSDGDGLGLSEEAALGTDSQRWDTDGDGMSDGWEADYSSALDPLDPDDAYEDEDGDLYANLIEYYRGSDPTSASSPSPEVLDTDHDGMPDDWEVAFGLNTNLASDALLDPDHDWYVNVLECATGGDPGDATTHGTHPSEPNGGAGNMVFPPSGSPHPSSVAAGLTGRHGVSGGAAPYGSTSPAGNHPTGNADKGTVTVAVHQSGSADSATIEIGGQQWSVPSGRFAAATNVFQLARGNSYTLTVTRGTALWPADDTVSLWWDIVPGNCVLLNSSTSPIINQGGDAIGSHAYQVDVLNVNMTRPDDKANSHYFHYVFNDASPGVCEVACKVNITPDTQGIRNQLQNKVQWLIDAIQGSTLTWQNGSSGPGNGVYYPAGVWEEKAIYTTLPNNNTEFGIKETAVTLIGLGCSQNGRAKVFYARNEKNHSGLGAGQTPNWYFYWSQTSANGGTHEYYGPGSDGNGRSYTAFINGQWRAMIGDAVESGSVTVNNITYSKGIDHFAFTSYHEEQHRVDLIALWGASYDRNPANDLDDDYLPDSQESNLVPNHPYSPNLTATYPDTWGYGQGWRDVEDYALYRQTYPTPGDYDAVDWSYPGNQWDSWAGDYPYTQY